MTTPLSQPPKKDNTRFDDWMFLFWKRVVSLGGDHPGYVASRYYSANYTTITATALTANRLYGSFFRAYSDETWTKIGCTVTTLGAGSSIRMGIYGCADGVPTKLIYDAGTVSSASTGDKEITINLALSEGAYFLALVCNATAPSINFHDVQYDNRFADLGAPAANTTGANMEGHVYRAFTYAALPDPFSTVTYSATQTEPHIWLRQ